MRLVEISWRFPNSHEIGTVEAAAWRISYASSADDHSDPSADLLSIFVWDS